MLWRLEFSVMGTGLANRLLGNALGWGRLCSRLCLFSRELILARLLSNRHCFGKLLDLAFQAAIVAQMGPEVSTGVKFGAANITLADSREWRLRHALLIESVVDIDCARTSRGKERLLVLVVVSSSFLQVHLRVGEALIKNGPLVLIERSKQKLGIFVCSWLVLLFSKLEAIPLFKVLFAHVQCLRSLLGSGAELHFGVFLGR